MIKTFFHRLVTITFLPDIDLFASRLNAKLDQFVSWHPEPMLLQLAIARPVLLPRVDHLLTPPHSNQVHPMLDSLHLTGWTLSGNPSLQKDFLMKQSVSSMHLGLQGPTSNTIQFGRDGVAGVKIGKLILFRHL